MIFLVIGLIFFFNGFLFFIFPAKKMNRLYGYQSYLAKQNQQNWQYAQKLSCRYFLFFGFLMTGIGLILKLNHWTNYFILEMIAIPWFVVPIFGLIEEQLQKFDSKQRGEENEYIDD